MIEEKNFKRIKSQKQILKHIHGDSIFDEMKGKRNVEEKNATEEIDETEKINIETEINEKEFKQIENGTHEINDFQHSENGTNETNEKIENQADERIETNEKIENQANERIENETNEKNEKIEKTRMRR